MNRLLPISLLALLLAACTTPSSVPPSADPDAPTPSAGPTAPVADDGPLRVPALANMKDSPARKLSGRFQPAAWNELPGYSDDDLAQVWPLFIRNCKALMRPTGGSLTTPARATPRAWQPVCAAAADPARAPAPGDTVAVRRFLQTWLTPWRLAGPDGRPAANTVTGYYEPLVRGSRRQGGKYQWPLHAVPSDLLVIDLGGVYPELAGKRVRGKLEGRRVVPYDSRAKMAQAPNPPDAIVYVDDPVDAFFLQIQGSGRVLLTDGPNKGQTLRLAYADHNGLPYASIGKWLADQGEIALAQASMQNIRAWAARNPQRVQEMLNANPAVVFFREEPIVDPELGPKGAYSVPLGAGRSIAVDTTFVPLGAPVFLSTTLPASSTPLNRLVFAQDTGAAIKGAARADYYWGYGDAAGEQAGRMKQRGQMWVLWPKQAGEPSAR